MKRFSYEISESKATFTISKEEFDKYKEAISNTKRTKHFTSLLWLVSKYPELLEPEKVENLVKGKNTCTTIDKKSFDELYGLVKKCGNEVKLLPQLLSVRQREFIIDGRIDPTDLMIDTDTAAGRQELAKKYVPLINKMVKQYIGQSSLSAEELKSAAFVGLVNAMNDYKNPEELENLGKTGKMSFTRYAAYRIGQQILYDINNYSRNVTISSYYQNKLKNNDESTDREVRIDAMFDNSEDGPAAIDRFLELSEEDDYMTTKEQDEAFRKLYDRLETKFSKRDCTVLYKVFGINGYKKEKTKDIAKELGISSPATTKIVAKILKFAANDPQCVQLKQAFESLCELYSQNILLETLKDTDITRNKVLESFLSDDIYIIIESIIKWNDKKVFTKAVNSATDLLCVDDALYIYNVISGKKEIKTDDIRKYKYALIEFLQNLYPYDTFANNDDIISQLKELTEISKKFKINW